MWNSHLPAERTDLTLQQALLPGMFNFLGNLCLDFLMVYFCKRKCNFPPKVMKSGVRKYYQ